MQSRRHFSPRETASSRLSGISGFAVFLVAFALPWAHYAVESAPALPEEARLMRPVDFLMVSGHAEYLGVMR
jgi:hypothetical protein